MLKSRVVDNLVPDERSDRELMQRALDDLMTAYAVNELYQTGRISDKAPIMQTITALRERLADGALLMHEMEHWYQAQRMGVAQFYWTYLRLLMRHGYRNHPMERV